MSPQDAVAVDLGFAGAGFATTCLERFVGVIMPHTRHLRRTSLLQVAVSRRDAGRNRMTSSSES
jgi:hypothetical protein